MYINRLKKAGVILDPWKLQKTIRISVHRRQPCCSVLQAIQLDKPGPIISLPRTLRCVVVSALLALGFYPSQKEELRYQYCPLS